MTRSPEGALHGQGRRSIAVLAAALLWAGQPAGTASAVNRLAPRLRRAAAG